MSKTKWMFLSMVAALLIIVSACGNAGDNGGHDQTKQNNMDGTDHSAMDHSGTGEVPEGLKEADNPKYPVGTKAIITADHMAGMKGAEATIVGAYDTTAYVVSYNPTNGGPRVENHKWVIHEEIDQAPNLPIEQNSEVSINVDHMPGMKGAVAVIDDLEETTVYMVDYTSTTGEKVKNHEWVTEEELKPVK